MREQSYEVGLNGDARWNYELLFYFDVPTAAEAFMRVFQSVRLPAGTGSHGQAVTAGHPVEVDTIVVAGTGECQIDCDEPEQQERCHAHDFSIIPQS